MKSVGGRPSGGHHLVSGVFSNRALSRGRGRSKNRMLSKRDFDERRIEVIRSLSDEEGPDDIFDMQERYNTVLRKRPSNDGAEGRDNVENVQKETKNQRESIDGEPFSHANYLLNLLDNLQIKEVLEGLQAGSMQMMSMDSKEDNTPEYMNQINELKARLEQAREESSNLSHKLKEVEDKYQVDSSRNKELISALEEKLTLQERNFMKRLKSEKNNKSNGSMDQSHNSHEDRGDQNTIANLKETVSALRDEVAELNLKKANLEASIDDRQSQLDKYVATTNSRIRDLEQRCSSTEQKLHNEQAATKKLELDLAKAKQMLELEQRKTKALELSEARAQMLLAAERKRADTIGGLNERMKSTMRKLSRKAMGQEGSKNQVEEMKKELEKRDARIKLIKTILNGKPGAAEPEDDGSVSRPIQVHESSHPHTGKTKLNSLAQSETSAEIYPKNGSTPLGGYYPFSINEECVTVWDE